MEVMTRLEVKKLFDLQPGDRFYYLGDPKKKVRQWIWYFAKKYNIGSLEWMGRQFNRDHSTALYGINTIKNLIETDKSKRILEQLIELKLKGKVQ